MMDFHIFIVISCVFLASLCSLLFINKFFRRKTFEEIIAEKKAMTEKIYGQTKTTVKKPKKLQLKKELKRERKQQRQKEQQKDTTEQEEDSDAQSEQPSVDEEPTGLSKKHLEFDPDPEVINNNTESVRRLSNVEKENLSAGGPSKPKSKKDKKSAARAGILVNKNEPVVVKEHAIVEESANHFELKAPKDSFELRKQEKEKEREKKDDKQQAKKEKNAKKDKHIAEKPIAIEPPVEIVAVAAKEVLLKQQEDKVRQGSPKNQQNNNAVAGSSGKTAKQHNKKQNKETAATRELVLALDKLNETDTIGVPLLMNLFRRAELNRSEIQILIDYLLNRQQDMPSSHSEWSDDICQKLKRQLEEKERALSEEQEASIGIQAKLRELRSEINSERAQMNATIKAYAEKLQGKDQEITGLNQEMQTLNEKLTQFQAKLLREKQAGTQDLLAQLQMMQKEMAHKDTCITELTCMVNASRQAVEESQQKNEIIQTQAQQIRGLEQQREELEQVSNNRIFEMENAKTFEAENAEYKVEVCNLQNALESSKVDLAQNRKELEMLRSELTLARTIQLNEKQNEIQVLQAKNDELSQQVAGISGKIVEQSKEQSGLQVTLDAVKTQLREKEKQLQEFHAKNAELLQQVTSIQTNSQESTQQQQELHKLVETLKADVANKHKQLQEIEQNAESFSNREKELVQQLNEQKEKNNDIRMKNWKLIEALQIAETTVKQNKLLSSSNAQNLVQQEQQLLAATNKITAAATTTVNPSASNSSSKDEQQVRDLFQRLYPDAVKACSGTALSVSFDQWVEQVLAAVIKQEFNKKATSNSNSNSKSTQSNNSNNSSSSSTSNNKQHNNSTTHNSHNDNDKLLFSETSSNSNNIRLNNNSSNLSSSDNLADVQKVHTENAQLRATNDELTKLVTKTSNTLSELENKAREQDEYWRGIVSSKDDQIYSLQHSNGQQDI